MKRERKVNNGSGNNIERDEWETPQELWNKINEQYDFSFDCCAKEKNTKIQSGFSSNFKEITFTNKLDIYWMNPPLVKRGKCLNIFLCL